MINHGSPADTVSNNAGTDQRPQKILSAYLKTILRPKSSAIMGDGSSINAFINRDTSKQMTIDDVLVWFRLSMSDIDEGSYLFLFDSEDLLSISIDQSSYVKFLIDRGFFHVGIQKFNLSTFQIAVIKTISFE